ncbi:putative retrotransposon hot spot (RHS) protein [Trypanosoma cruzi]|nr:putative retrotransposon hot spot (RHS) protein [Trypanosoma cruzi]
MSGCAAAQPWHPRPPSCQPATHTHNPQEVARHRRASSIVFPNAFLNASYGPHTSTIVEHVPTTESRYERERAPAPILGAAAAGAKHTHTHTLRIRPGPA